MWWVKCLDRVVLRSEDGFAPYVWNEGSCKVCFTDWGVEMRWKEGDVEGDEGMGWVARLEKENELGSVRQRRIDEDAEIIARFNVGSSPSVSVMSM